MLIKQLFQEIACRCLFTNKQVTRIKIIEAVNRFGFRLKPTNNIPRD